MAAPQGYDYGPDTFAQLLIAKSYPERTDYESALLRDYLKAHLAEYDRVAFSVRIGEGATPNPEHLPAIQAASVFSSRRRIDFVGWNGRHATLIEIKTRVSHEVMGQLLSDRQLWLEAFPDEPEPRLVALGRRTDDEAIRVLTSHSITVVIIDAPTAQ